MTTHPMSPVDAAWYHMDGPANLAMVTSVMLTKAPLDFDKVRAVYSERLAGFDQASRSQPLLPCFGIGVVLDVIAREDVGV